MSLLVKNQILEKIVNLFFFYSKVLDYDSNSRELLHRWLKVDQGRMTLGVSKNEEDASIFKLIGSIHGKIRVSCTVNGIDHYWTYCRDNSKIILTENHVSNFIMNCKIGEQLCAFNTDEEHNSKVLKFDQTENQIVLGKTSRKVTVDETVMDFALAYKANCGQTFMIMPKDNDTKFYLSLNMMFNSLRFEEEDHLIKMDGFLADILARVESAQRDKPSKTDHKDIGKVEKYDPSFYYHICDYCFIFLTRPLTIEITKELCRDEDSKPLYKKCHEIIEVHHKFLEALEDEDNYRNNPAIQSSKYMNYLQIILEKTLKKQSEWQYRFWKFILEEILKSKQRPKPWSEKLKQYQSVTALKLRFVQCSTEIGESLMNCFGKTNEIIQSVVTRFDKDKDYSGHMAIIRTSSKDGIKHGKMLRQSLCIARYVANRHDFEIIEDYCSQSSSKATLGEATKLKNHVKNNMKEAKEENTIIQLRILKKIQVDQCQETDRFGISNCSCKNYIEDEEDEFELRCQKCNHYHKEFNSYSDLIGLPCLLILVNNGRMGDTFPSSLMAMDGRIHHMSKLDKVYLSTFAQEVGRLCRYTKRSTKLPKLYLSTKLYKSLKENLRDDCAYYNYFVNKGWIDPKVKYNKTNCQLVAKSRHIDYIKDKKKRMNHFLLVAEPQCGKTGVYLHLISLLRQVIGKTPHTRTHFWCKGCPFQLPTCIKIVFVDHTDIAKSNFNYILVCKY